MFVRTLFDSLIPVMACTRYQPQTPSGIIDVRSLSLSYASTAVPMFSITLTAISMTAQC